MRDDERENTMDDKIIIISVPEKDDPSQFKTVSTYTFPNTSDPRFENRDRLSYFTPKSIFSYLPSRKTVFWGLGLVLSFYYILGFISYSDSPFDPYKENNENIRNEEKSILLDLHPKFQGGENRTRSINVGSVKIQSNSVKSLKIGSSVVLPLKGNVFPDGQYYVSIFIGNPPRPYFLDVDTGSDLTWIQCDAPCASCAKGPHPLYKPSKEKIVQPRDSLCRDMQRNLNNKHCGTCKQCDYTIEYADRSSSMGVLAKDDMHVISMTSRTKFGFVFGCGYDQRGNLLASPAKTDGILGLSTAKVSLPTQLADKGIIKNVVGHCIRSEARGGGYMFFGDDFVPSWGMTWVPTFNSFLDLYMAKVHKLSYGDQQTSISGQVVFDTGSSFTYFPEEAYSSLIANFDSFYGVLDREYSDTTVPVCWHAANPLRFVNEVNQLFQPITLQFAKSWWMMPRKFIIPPEGYLIISKKGNVCLGILNGTEVHDGSTIILGDISLHGKLIVYDNVQQKIGWTSSSCVKPQGKPVNFLFF